CDLEVAPRARPDVPELRLALQDHALLRAVLEVAEEVVRGLGPQVARGLAQERGDVAIRHLAGGAVVRDENELAALAAPDVGGPRQILEVHPKEVLVGKHRKTARRAADLDGLEHSTIPSRSTRNPALES